MRKISLVAVLLVLVAGLSANAAVIYNPCSNLSGFSTTGYAATDWGMDATGGPGGSSCWFFVTRANNNHTASWDFADISFKPGDSFSFDIQNIVALGVANVDVRYIIDNGSGGDQVVGAAPRVNLATNNWVHVSCNTASFPYTLKRIDFSVVENTKVINLDNLSIVPEPATMSLLALGGLLLRKRS